MNSCVLGHKIVGNNGVVVTNLDTQGWPKQ